MKAIYGNNKKIIEILLECKELNLNVKNKHNDTPLTWLAKKGNVEVFKMFLKRSDIDVNFDENLNPLEVAIKNNCIGIVEILLKRSDIILDSYVHHYIVDNNENDDKNVKHIIELINKKIEKDDNPTHDLKDRDGNIIKNRIRCNGKNMDLIFIDKCGNEFEFKTTYTDLKKYIDFLKNDYGIITK